MQDNMPHIDEFRPYWRHIDDGPFPRNAKCLWKGDFTAALIGVWYEECGWSWWSPLPSHSPEDKKRRRNSWEHPEKTITA